VQQGGTAKSRSFYARYEIVVWWATPVEMASAVSRLLRTNAIKVAEWSDALKIAATLASAWSVIEPSSRLRTRAEQIVQQYDLHAGDAFQLAAALEWCEETPQGQAFLTADNRLLQAALLSGFDAVSL
jgi:predicted nucleic acid-binding protein